MSKKSKQQLEEELKAMKAENKRLQEALELEKLRSMAYDTMIDEKNVQWTFDSGAVNQRRTSTSP